MADKKDKHNSDPAAFQTVFDKLWDSAARGEIGIDPFQMIFDYDLTGGRSVEFAPGVQKDLDELWKESTKYKHWEKNESAFAERYAQAYWQAFYLHRVMFNHNVFQGDELGASRSDAIHSAQMEDRALESNINQLITSLITRNALKELADPASDCHIADTPRAVHFLGNIIRESIATFGNSKACKGANYASYSVFPIYVKMTPEELVQEAMKFPDERVSDIQHLNKVRLDNPIQNRW